MKHLNKFIIITLLTILSIILISCKNKDTSFTLDDIKQVSLSTNKDEELDTILNQNNYKEISANIYLKNSKIVEKTASIAEASTIERYINNEEISKAFTNKYKSTFFNNHLLVLYYLTYECNVYNVYYDGEDIEIILTDINKNKSCSKTLIFELDFSSLVENDISIPGILIKDYASINIHSIDEAKVFCSKELLNLDTPSSLIKYNDNVLTKEDSIIIANSLQNITYVKTSYDSNDDPLYTISYDDTTLIIYNNRFFDIVKDSVTTNARIIDGSLLFGITFDEAWTNPNPYSLKVLDFVYWLDNTYIFFPSIINDIISFATMSNSFEYPLDFDELSQFEKLDYIYNNEESLNEENKDLLSYYTSMFKYVFGKEINYNVSYKLTVVNNDICGKDIPVNEKTVNKNDTIDIKNYLSMVPQNRYLIGWYDFNNNMLPINFNYAYYSDLKLTVKTIANDDYEIVNQEITKVNTNYDIVYLPLFDTEGKEITTISDNLFKDNQTIKEIYINGNITSIGEHAFDGCSNLEKIVIGSKVTSIGDYAFANCPKLFDITFEEGLTTLGNYMFVNDTSIKVINIPASMDDLKDHVFEGCTSIEAFNVNPNNKKFYSACNNIMEDTTLYYGCKNSTIPAGTVFIREYAFYGVTGLEKIYIPSCVVHIDTSAFHNCSGLKYVYISQSVMWNAKNAFNTGTNTTIDCEYHQKMNGWVALWTTGTTVNWSVPQPE